jgi:hypothetical protein
VYSGVAAFGSVDVQGKLLRVKITSMELAHFGSSKAMPVGDKEQCPVALG